MDWYPPQKRLLVPRMKGTKIKLINRKEGNKIAKKIKTSHGAATRPKVEEKGEKKRGMKIGKGMMLRCVCSASGMAQ